MRIVMTGLSHRTAPLAVREALSLSREEIPAALESLKESVGRGVILSTCNRIELYAVAREAKRGQEALSAFFETRYPAGPDELRRYLYPLEQEQAVRHLFRVSSGLDSLIIGESEILGQVRDAFGIASRGGLASGVLAHLFHSALRAGKRARTETAIGRNALSVSRACVELTRRVRGDAGFAHALVIGVGEASRLAAQALRDAGTRTVTIANRTPENARELAAELDAEVVPFEHLPRAIAEADVVVSSTGAPDFVVGRTTVEEAMTLRSGPSLLIIDMAVPRDVAPEVAAIDGVELYTMDDLESIAESNRRERETEAGKVERIVDDEVDRFAQWWESRSVAPTIASIRHRAEALRAAEVAKTLRSAGELTPAQEQKIDALTKALVKKLLHQPTKTLRERKDESFTQSARELFALDDG